VAEDEESKKQEQAVQDAIREASKKKKQDTENAQRSLYTTRAQHRHTNYYLGTVENMNVVRQSIKDTLANQNDDATPEEKQKSKNAVVKQIASILYPLMLPHMMFLLYSILEMYVFLQMDPFHLL
jgi:hypothetical protein